MRNPRIWMAVVLVALCAALPAFPASTTIVISQVYGGGGNAGATYTNDFIELFNLGSTTVSIAGWSVQYASASGTSWAKTDLTGSIPAGGYYLIQEAAGAGGTIPLPTPDATGSLAMSGTNGKVALVNNGTLLTGNGCPFAASVVDFVGYGSANCFEGAGATPVLSNTTAAIRGSSGCTETDNNNTDFATGAPTPRNSASPTHSCGPALPVLSINDVTLAEGNSGTTTFSFTVSVSPAAPAGGVTFDIATADGTAVAPGDYTANTLTGQTIAAGGTSYTFNVLVNGDVTPEPPETFVVNITNVSAGVTVGDAQGQGTITNDDAPLPDLTINDVTAVEGNSGTTTFTFTVSLSAVAPTGGVTFDIATANGTAAPPGDYTSQTLTGQTIAAGGTTYTFNVLVVGETAYEPNETFTVNITNLVNANPTDLQGLGTITNDDALEIFQIQGSGAASPYVGQTVPTANNVVTAVGPQGFFIQTPTARDDGNINTSNGIYVYTNTTPTVHVGDLVNVTALVQEYYNFTELSSPTVTFLSGGNPLPAPVAFNGLVPSPNPAVPSCAIEYECYESMLIDVANGMVTGPNQYFATDPFAEMLVVADRFRTFRDKGIEYPGVAGLPVWDGNPEIFELDPNRLGLPNAVLPAGTPFSATGVLAYEFNDYELWPTSLDYTTPPMPRPVRAKATGELTVGSYNLYRLFDTVDDPPLGDPTYEDIVTQEEYDRRLTKHSWYIREVLGAPDVLGVEEVEKLDVLQALADKIHADDSSITYTAYLQEGHDVGYIDNGFLVRDTVSVSSVDQLGYDEEFTYGGETSWLHDRPPLLLQGQYLGNGEPFEFAVMVNHTRSIDTSARVRAKRLAQALSIAEKLDAFQDANPTVPFVMVGDLNAFEVTDSYVDVVGQMAGDAVQAENMTWAPNITTPVFVKEAIESVVASDRYSYIFGGTSQVLDHALTTQTTHDTWVRGMEYGRGNSDCAVNFLYDDSTVLRASDHDGLVLYLMSDGNGNGIPDDLDSADLAIAKGDAPDPVLAGGTLTYTLTVTNNGPTPAHTVKVIDTLPAGFALGTATGTDWVCAETLGVVTCTLPILASGSSSDITIVGTVTAGGGILTNTATVSCPLTDPSSANNLATSSTTVTPMADLQLVMDEDLEVAAPGQTFVHSATVTNLGTSTATDATLTLTLPPGASIGVVTQGNYRRVDSSLVFVIGTLAKDATFTVSINLSAATSGTYTTLGAVTANELDLDMANNTDEATTVVGQVLVAPNPINMRVPVFSTGQSTMTITNDSPLDISYQLFGRVILPTWELWPYGTLNTWQMPAEHRGETTARAVPSHPLPSIAVQPLAPITVLDFPSGLVYPWGIGLNYLANDMWIGDIAVAGGDDLDHRFLLDGTPTTDTIDTSSWVGVFAADMTFDPFSNRLWQVNVGGDDCIHELDPVTKTSTGNVICPDWGGVSERGLAFDSLTDTFFTGTWEDGAIQRFDRTGTVIEKASVGLDISGLAYNPATQHLFVLANTDAAADLYVLDVADGYAVVASYKVAGMGDYEQAGLEADCAGTLYAVNQITGQVLVLPSGETGFCNIFDIPWLTPTPISGAITAGATQPITLDFTTALQWPGLHRAELTVAGTTPFASQTVPVNYTIAFLDVPATHWADVFIHGLAGARVTRGCGEGNFCPDTELTRAEMAVLMVRAMHGPLYSPPSATGLFVDVPISDTDRTADFVEQLYHDGVVAGCAVGGGGELYYCPDDLVTRAQMAVFIVAGSGLAPVNPPTHYFTDCTGHWAEGFIESIFNEGITAGCGINLFCPEDNITRAQLAVWLVVAFDIPYLH